MSGATRYIDQEAFERYADHDGQEVVVSLLVPASPAVAFDTFIDRVWKKVAIGEERPGRGRGMVGHVRRVPLGIHEEILSAGEPRDLDDDAIPSILYRLVKFGPMPLQDHLGFVRFVPDTSSQSASPQTLVIWTIKTVPTTFGNVFLCGGSLLRLSLRGALAVMLRTGMSVLSKDKIRQD